MLEQRQVHNSKQKIEKSKIQNAIKRTSIKYGAIAAGVVIGAGAIYYNRAKRTPLMGKISFSDEELKENLTSTM